MAKRRSAAGDQAGRTGGETRAAARQEYCMDREDLDFVLDVTKFKTKAPWGEDPWKPVPPATKAALTRALHADAGRPRCSLAVEEFKKGRKGKRGAAAAAPDEDGIGTGARPSVRLCAWVWKRPATRHSQRPRGAPQSGRGETGLVVCACGVLLIASRSWCKASGLSAALGRHARAPEAAVAPARPKSPGTTDTAHARVSRRHGRRS